MFIAQRLVKTTTIVRTPDPSQVGVEKVNIIGWVDLTKNGVLGQKDVNRVGLWCEKLIAKNLTGCSAHLSEEFGLLLMPSHPSFSLVGTRRSKGSCVVIALPLLASTVGCGSLRFDNGTLVVEGGKLYIYICVYICVYMYIYIYVYIYMYIYMYDV